MFTAQSKPFCCEQLWNKYLSLFVQYYDIAMSYETDDDERTLVVVLSCPCCTRDPKLNTPNAVLVSPYRDLVRLDYEIKTPDKCPPFYNPGKGDEAATDEEFLEAFEDAIERALDREAVA